MSARMKLKALRQRAKNSMASTEAIREAKPKTDFKLEPQAPAPKAKPKPKNSTFVEAIFKEELLALYGAGYFVPRWTVKERTLAMRLLKDYGEELTEKAVRFFVKDWPNLVARSRGKVKGAPNVAFMWGARHMVFGEVQGGAINCAKADPKVDKKNSDEYKESNDSDIGW